jgi:hypothetical protein
LDSLREAEGSGVAGSRQVVVVVDAEYGPQQI